MNAEIRAIARTPREPLHILFDLMKMYGRGFERIIKLSNLQLRRMLRAEESRLDADPTYEGGQWDTSSISPSEDGDIESFGAELDDLLRDLASNGFEPNSATEGHTAAGEKTARPGRRAGTPVDGPKLKNLRLALKPKLTQAEFADKCGISEDCVQRGEAGQRWSDATFETVAHTLCLLGARVTTEDLKNRKNRTN